MLKKCTFKYLNILLMAFFMLGAGVSANAQESKVSLNTKYFSQIAILHQGRVKPLDSFARHFMLQLSGKSSYEGENALAWVTQLIFDPESVRDDRIFLVNHPETLQAAGIENSDERRWSFDDLIKGYFRLESLALQAQEKEDPKDLTLVEREIIRLTDNMLLYMSTAQSFAAFQATDDFEIDSAETKKLLEISDTQKCCSYMDIVMRAPMLHETIQSMEGVDADQWSDLQTDAFRLINKVYQWSNTDRDGPLKIIPHIKDDKRWSTALEASLSGGLKNPVIREQILYLIDLYNAWNSEDQVGFDRAAISFNVSIRELRPNVRALKMISLENIYNWLNSFFWAKVIYVLALLWIIVRLIQGVSPAYLPIKLFIASAWLIHSFGLVARIYVLARPPVTNLFETFLFVSWVTVFAGLVIKDDKANKGLGSFVAAFTGSVILFISGKFAAEGDTMKMLVAVLDSNFWLSTHVITVTIGYAGCCVAAVIGHIYLIQRVIKDKKENLKKTFRTLYLSLGWGLAFSFLGTILGGVWADQSWGRFWGWDPKENGALMIVLWSAMIYHARLAGLIKERGFAVLAALGLIVVMWAWFGVNLLSVGLHSYGFTEGTGLVLVVCLGLDLLLISVLASLSKTHILKLNNID